MTLGDEWNQRWQSSPDQVVRHLAGAGQGLVARRWALLSQQVVTVMGGGAHRHATQHGVHEEAQPCRSCRLFHWCCHATHVALAIFLRLSAPPICEPLSPLLAHPVNRCSVLRLRCPLRLTAVPPAACCYNAPLASNNDGPIATAPISPCCYLSGVQSPSSSACAACSCSGLHTACAAAVLTAHSHTQSTVDTVGVTATLILSTPLAFFDFSTLRIMRSHLEGPHNS